MLKKTILFLSIYNLSFGQKLEVGGGLGPTYYKGDIQPTFRIFSPMIGTNLFVRYNASKVLSLKANAMVGLVGGNDRKSGNVLNEYRGLKFNNILWDYNAQVEYNFLNFRTHNGRYEHQSTPYLFGGLGNMQFLRRQFTTRKDVKTDINAYGPDPILPFGIGYKIIINSNWNFGVEFGTRVLLSKKNSDLFDGFGFKAKTKTTQNLYIAQDGADKNILLLNYPNTLQKDKYFYLNFTVSYLFYKVHCPTGG